MSHYIYFALFTGYKPAYSLELYRLQAGLKGNCALALQALIAAHWLIFITTIYCPIKSKPTSVWLIAFILYIFQTHSDILIAVKPDIVKSPIQHNDK